MIRLFIKENKRDDNRLIVRDDRGQILYLIEGSWGQKNDIINVYSLHGELILQAKQTKLSPFFKFNLFQSRKKIGTIRKHPGFFGLRDAFFTIHPQDWIVKGNFEKLHFTVYKKNKKIMDVTQIINNANYLFSLNVKKGENLALASLLTILLDHYSRKKEKNKSHNELEQNNLNLGFLHYESYPNFYSNKQKRLQKTRLK